MIVVNKENPYEHDETRGFPGDGGEWIFPSICPHCKYELYKSDIEWIDVRKAKCPKCGGKIYAQILHDHEKEPPQKERA